MSDSLVLLASLRPRSTGDSSSLIPPPEFLRKLHRRLPTEPSEGWSGTLPPSNLTALRDDTTLQIKPGVNIPVAALSGPASTRLPSPAPRTTNQVPSKHAAHPHYATLP